METEKKYEKIEFNVERDFSDTINVSFTFLKQNFKRLFFTLLYLVGPFLLITSILNGIYAQGALDFSSLMQGNYNPLNVFSPMYFLAIISTIISGLLLVGITYEYMNLYERLGYAKFEIIDVWNEFKKDVWAIIGAFFGLILVMLIFGIAASIVVGIFSLMGTAGGVIIAILLIGGLLIVLFPLAFVFTVIYLVIIREKIGFWGALSKVRAVLNNNFWNTWVVILISYLIVAILSAIFTIPQAIVVGLVGFNSIQGDFTNDYSLLIIIFTTIGVFGGSLVRALFFIMAGFHYYSLNEQKQGAGLLSQIDGIGSPDDSEDEEITI